MARQAETPEGRSVRLLRVVEQVRHALADILMRGMNAGCIWDCRCWPLVRC